MAVKIRLKRMGKIRAPYYRVVVADSRTKRDGRAIEEIGKYHPIHEPSLVDIDSDRVQYWLGVGAQPSEQVLALLKVTGDWQRFKGLPGAEGTLRAPEAKPDRQALYEAAMREAGGEPAGEATTSRSRKPKSAPKAQPDTAVPAGAAPEPVHPDAKGAPAAAPEAAAPEAAAPEADAPEAAQEADAKAPPRCRAASVADTGSSRPEAGMAATGGPVLGDAVEHLVRGIVAHPDDVQVDVRPSRRGTTVRVRVHPEDVGKVIGRTGRTATALRTVVNALTDESGVRIDIVGLDER